MWPRTCPPKSWFLISSSRCPRSSAVCMSARLAVSRRRRTGRPRRRTGYIISRSFQYLRLVCADPRDYGIEAFSPEDPAAYRRKAPKMDWLLQTLRGIRIKAEKALVFAESRDIQLLLQHYIHAEFGFRPQIVNGDTAVSA